MWVLLATLALAFAALVGSAFYNVATAVPRGTPSVVAPYLVSVVTPWMMWMIVFGLIWFAFAPTLSRANRRTVRSFLLLVLGLVLVLYVIDAVTTGPHPAAAAKEPPGDRSGSVLSTLTPWVVIFLVMWFVVFRVLRGATRKGWDAQPQLRLPQTLERTERGLRFDDGRAAHDYAWAAFRKFRESTNVFLVYASDVAFEIVPKRAFAQPADLEAFRQLLRQHVADADAVPAPGAPPVPVPAIPVPEPAT